MKGITANMQRQVGVLIILTKQLFDDLPYYMFVQGCNIKEDLNQIQTNLSCPFFLCLLLTEWNTGVCIQCADGP